MEYLSQIEEALNDLYNKDEILVQRLEDKKRMYYTPHEQTITFRIALHLSRIIEKTNFYVDCEYHGAGGDRKKILMDGNKTQRVRPDIIFHDRSSNNSQNFFCIEVKKRSPGKDIYKMQGYIENYNYKEGYCICNIRPNSLHILTFSKPCTQYYQLKYQYNPNNKKLDQVDMTICKISSSQ